MNMLTKVEGISTTFDVNDVYDITFSFFPKSFKLEGKHILIDAQSKLPYDIYSEIEDCIYDARLRTEAVERREFVETIEIMSWAIYRVWNKAISAAVETKETNLTIDRVDNQEVLTLFWENLDCDEGKLLRKRLLKK